MSTTYTTADGATLRPRDEFFAVAAYNDAIRIKRVGTGHVVSSDYIPCVGGTWCDRRLAFLSKSEAMRFMVVRHENAIAAAEQAISRAKAQIKRDRKALLKLAELDPMLDSSAPAEGSVRP